jgi:hypothetical protein
MKLHQINCLFAKNVMIPNKIVYKPRWECVSFLSRALALEMKHFPPRYVIYYYILHCNKNFISIVASIFLYQNNGTKGMKIFCTVM